MSAINKTRCSEDALFTGLELRYTKPVKDTLEIHNKIFDLYKKLQDELQEFTSASSSLIDLMHKTTDLPGKPLPILLITSHLEKASALSDSLSSIDKYALALTKLQNKLSKTEGEITKVFKKIKTIFAQRFPNDPQLPAVNNKLDALESRLHAKYLNCIDIFKKSTDVLLKNKMKNSEDLGTLRDFFSEFRMKKSPTRLTGGIEGNSIF